MLNKGAGLIAGFLVAGALTLVSAVPAGGQPSVKKPNLIFVLGDDVGIGDIACTGADRYRTPHIDSLAKGGMIFTRAYGMP